MPGQSCFGQKLRRGVSVGSSRKGVRVLIGVLLWGSGLCGLGGWFSSGK